MKRRWLFTVIRVPTVRGETTLSLWSKGQTGAGGVMLFVIRYRISMKWPLAVFRCVSLLGLLLGVGWVRLAAAQDINAYGKWIDFDIPAQPLAGALNAYGSATHIQLFVDADLTAGRRSAPLRGVFTSEAGLLALIAGTGLAAFRIGDEGFTLVSQRRAQPDDGGEQPQLGLPSFARGFAEYSARLQRDLTVTLCRNANTRPGGYRTLVRLWIDSSGSIAQAGLLTSTGDRTRDISLLDVLRNLAVGGLPPAGLPQPITLLLAPGAKPADDYCSPGGTTPRRAEVTP